MYCIRYWESGGFANSSCVHRQHFLSFVRSFVFTKNDSPYHCTQLIPDNFALYYYAVFDAAWMASSFSFSREEDCHIICCPRRRCLLPEIKLTPNSVDGFVTIQVKKETPNILMIRVTERSLFFSVSSCIATTTTTPAISPTQSVCHPWILDTGPET